MPPSSQLLRGITAEDTTLPMLSAAPFLVPGRMLIDGEFVRCAAKNEAGEAALTGCVRGVDQDLGGSPAAPHIGGTLVVQVDAAIRGLVYASNDVSNTIVNTADETAFDNFYTFPPNALEVGKAIRVRAWGRYNTHSAGTMSQIFRLRWGGLAGSLLAVAPVTFPTSATNYFWFFDWQGRITSLGVAGTLNGFGLLHAFNAADASTPVAFRHSPSNQEAAIDTTAAAPLVLTADWGAAHASNAITMHDMTVEVLN